MTCSISKSDCVFIYDWLVRTNSQYDEATPKKIKEADYDRARQSLRLENITNNYFLSSPPPTHGFHIDNSTTTQNITNVYHAGDLSKDKNIKKDKNTKAEEEKSKTEEKKTNWGAIATIDVVSTSIVGITLFTYARLSKANEGATNYLENTKKIKNWATFSSVNQNISEMANDIGRIAKVQLKIDQRAADKVKIYKYSALTGLVGTLAMASGGITIFAAAPSLATAATTPVVLGGILNLIAGACAIYNCGDHWSDEKDGKEEFSRVKALIPKVIEQLNSLQTCGQPSSYAESEAAIRKQRANSSNIYPDLSDEFMNRYQFAQFSAPTLF